MAPRGDPTCPAPPTGGRSTTITTLSRDADTSRPPDEAGDDDGAPTAVGETPDDELTGGTEGYRLIRRTVATQWRGLAIGVTVGLVWTAGKVAIPAMVQRAIDEGIDAGDLDAVRTWAIAIGVAAVIASVFTGLRRYWAFREARMVEARLRDQLYAHVQRLHFAFHDRTATGDLLSRGNTDLQQVQNLVVLIPLTISNAVTVLAVTVYLATINVPLTVAALGALPLLNYLGKRFSTRLHPEVMGIQHESAELAAVVEETVSGVRVVKGFGAESVQGARLSKEAEDLYDVSMRAAEVRARFLPAMELLPNVGLIAVLAFGGHLALRGTITTGELVAFSAYIGLLVWPLRMLGMIIAQAQRSAASAERVHEVLATAPEIVDPDHPVVLPEGPPVGDVVFDDVSFTYEGGHRAVLEHLALRVAPGTSVALVGATGSGKSTLAQLLCRFYDVQGGAVRLDGVDVRDVDLLELRRAVAIVFEETFLFSDSIAANIAFARPEASDEEVRRAARLAGADEFVQALPEGYDTVVGERGFSLSGGQRQRLSIARAILADPRVLILDDATSAVDPTKEHEIRDAMEEVMRDRTTLVIAHRPATIALADRVVLLGDGVVVAEGTHDELLATSAAYRQVLAAALVDDDTDDDAAPAGPVGPHGGEVSGGRRR